MYFVKVLNPARFSNFLTEKKKLMTKLLCEKPHLQVDKVQEKLRESSFSHCQRACLQKYTGKQQETRCAIDKLPLETSTTETDFYYHYNFNKGKITTNSDKVIFTNFRKLKLNRFSCTERNSEQNSKKVATCVRVEVVSMIRSYVL